jgi:hypothetical protein
MFLDFNHQLDLSAEGQRRNRGIEAFRGIVN